MIRSDGDRLSDNVLDLIGVRCVVFKQMASLPVCFIDRLAKLVKHLIKPADHHSHWVLPAFRAMQVHQVVPKEQEESFLTLSVDLRRDRAKVGDAFHEIRRLGRGRRPLRIQLLRGGNGSFLQRVTFGRDEVAEKQVMVRGRVGIPSTQAQSRQRVRRPITDEAGKIQELQD